MKNGVLWIALAVVITGVSFIGCSDDDQDVLSSNGNENVVIAAISPADGASDVSTSSSIAVKFTGPVDAMSVMQNLHLTGGKPMHEWRDSLSHYGGFGMMNMNMEDHMMAWMDSIHTRGKFHWNGSLDSCEFVPDSALMANTEYLCLLFEGGMHDSHGGMVGGANHNDNGYHMYSFTTGP